MKKVISYSLWGNKPVYNIGAIENARTAPAWYPGFECWFYVHVPSVPNATIAALQATPGTKVLRMEGDLDTCKPMMWRFEAIDSPDVSVMLSRDTDSRFLLREKMAVEHWLGTTKTFHIMRDHPHHQFCILGGMFGTRKIADLPNWSAEMEKVTQREQRNYDQDFLRDSIYPRIKNDCMIHASFNKYEDSCLDFPIPYDANFRFVGEYIYENGSRSQHHVKELLLGMMRNCVALT